MIATIRTAEVDPGLAVVGLPYQGQGAHAVEGIPEGVVLPGSRVHLHEEDNRLEGDHLAVEACLRVVEVEDREDWVLDLALGRLGRRGVRLGDVGLVDLGMALKDFSPLL